MSLVEQAVQVLFTGTEQKTKDKVVRVPGKLIAATNVVQRETGTFSKRYGYGVLNRTTNTGSITAAQGLVSAGSLVLHADDQLWQRDSMSNTWKSRGKQVRAFATDVVAISKYSGRPHVVITGGQRYYFALTPLPLNGTYSYVYRIADDATGVETKAATSVALTSVSQQLRAVSAGGFVWLFYGTNASVSVAKFDPSNPTAAPTTTTYFAPTIAAMNWDVVPTVNGASFLAYASGTSQILVAGVNSTMWLSNLDTATGLPKATPGNVAYAAAIVTSGSGHPPGWITYDGTNGFLYAVYTANTGGNNTYRVIRFNATTLVGAEHNTATWPGASVNLQIGGYSTDGDTVQLLVSDVSNGGSGLDAENAKIHRYTHAWTANTSSVTLNWQRGANISTEPFKVGTTWYFITNHDDTGGALGNLERSYCLRLAATGQIVARALFGRGGNYHQKGDSSAAGYSAVSVQGTKVYTALIGSDGIDGEFHTREVVWDLADAYGPMRAVQNDQIAIMPGGWPVRLGDTDSTLAEVIPMMWPRTFVLSAPAGTSGGLGAGTYGVQHLYVVRDARGNVYRSSPCPLQSIAVPAGNVARSVVPTLRQGQGAAAALIETYMTAPGGTTPFLAKTTANDPTVDTLTIEIVTAAATSAETLYTANSVVPNYPVPPFKIAQGWKNRVFLSDTDVLGEVWPSKEASGGFGLAFSPNTIFKLNEGTGRIRAMGVVDFNYLAFFKQDTIHVISGDGPNDQAQGQYTPQQVPGQLGCTNPSSVVGNTPIGCFFQATDGGIWLLGRSLDVTYIGRGVDDHKSATVTGAAHFAKEQLVRFTLNSGKILVFDYGNPTAEDPQGQWYVHGTLTGVALTNHGDVAHFVDSTGVVWKETAGQWFDNTSTPIATALEIAPISFSGFLGYQQCMRGQVMASYLGANTMQVTLRGDFSATSDVRSKAFAAGPQDVEFRPVNTRKNTAMGVRIEETGGGVTEGFAVQGIAFELLIEPRMRRLNTTARI